MKVNTKLVAFAGALALTFPAYAEENYSPADNVPAYMDTVDEPVPEAEVLPEATVESNDEAPIIEPLEVEPDLFAANETEPQDTGEFVDADQSTGQEGTTAEVVEPEEILAVDDAVKEEEDKDVAAENGNEVTNELTTDETGMDAEGDVLIPLIVMDEVPLMDTIRNLARQAGINYMVDPQVPYGQIGPDGKMTPQPVLSLRWEDVTAQQALLAVLNNYNLQIKQDHVTKIHRISVKDPDAPDPLVTKIIQLKYSSPSNVVAALKTTFTDKRSKVVPDVRTSQIVVVATELEMIEVDKMVERLDTPTRQVLIEARIMETTANPSTIKGIDWTGTLKDQKVTFGNDSLGTGNLFAETIQNGMRWNPHTFFLTADGLSATLNFLNQSADTKQLSTPRAVTLDNETAHLQVTRAVPIFKNTAGTQGSPGGSEVTYTNLGVILDVTPRISANDTINLKVIPEISRVFTTIEKEVANTRNEADVYDIRKIETRVLIPSGNTLVMGGLLADETRTGHIKVPIMGDIPVLGHFFRQDSKERDKVNLLIFITPTIVEDSDFQPTPTDFLKTKFTPIDPKPWGPWDSGVPKDWSRRKKDNQ